MKIKTIIAVVTILLVAVFFCGQLCAQEIPKPGATIDKSNYKKYAHLFPPEFAPAFESGFDGLIQSIHMKVVETRPMPNIKSFLDYSAKNKGKYSLDAQGNIAGGFNREGLPFPEISPTDKDFAAKIMWNYDCRYQFDEGLFDALASEKRRGEPIRRNTAPQYIAYFKSRMVVAPTPDLPNPIGLYKGQLFHWTSPESMKNTIMLSYRYIDSKKPDDIFLYLPAMRRVLRAEGGQRSTPLMGSIVAPDDMFGFDGRIPDFNYVLVREQKVLAVTDSKMAVKDAKNFKAGDLPFTYDSWEVRDVYVIDIMPKDPRYPQSKKRIWIDKERGAIFYVVTWDRAGKVWKMWTIPFRRHAAKDGVIITAAGMIGLDVQFGMANTVISDNKVNALNLTYDDYTPAAVLKRARQ